MSEALTLGSIADAAINDSLSPRERQILVMAAEGLTDQGIAHGIGISRATVATYWGRIRVKYGQRPRAELVAQFVRAEMARASLDLSRTEAQLRAILETSAVGIILADPSGTILYVNAAYERIAGRDRENLVGHRAIEIIHPEDRVRVEAEWSRCVREGRPYTAEYRYVRPDGIAWIRSRGDTWRQGKKMGGRVGIIEDITESVRTEHARARAEQRFRNLFALAPEAIITMDAQHVVLEFNPGAERTFGYDAEEIVGRTLFDLIPERFRTPHAEHVASFGIGTTMIARPMASRTEVVGRRKGGEEFPCEVSILRETVDGRPLFTAILRDVSNRLPISQSRSVPERG